MTWSDAAALALDHAGGLAWALFVGVALWSLIGVAVAIGGYQIAKRTGALRLPVERRWPRLVLGLALALGTVPLFGAAGALTGMRDTAGALIDDEVATPAVTEALGELLLAARAQGEGAVDDAADTVPPWAWRIAERRVEALLAEHRSRYDALFAAATPREVGRAFVERELRPQVVGAFDGPRRALVILAVVLPLLVVGVVRVAAWRIRSGG